MTPSSTPDVLAAHLRGTTSNDLAVAALAMARRFEAGATMWCLSPAFPQYARDIVAEFMHPTDARARALRAVAVGASDPVSQLRVEARIGDLLLAISTADRVEVAAAMRRAPAWGLTTIWIGNGARPEPGAADNVLWVDSDYDVAAHVDAFLALWHRLRDLTHAFLGDPSLVEGEDPGVCLANGDCFTCSDEGHLGEIVTARTAGDFDRLAVARTAGGLEEIDASLVGEIGPGDLVVIHAGSAIGLVESAGATTGGTRDESAGGTAR